MPATSTRQGNSGMRLGPVARHEQPYCAHHYTPKQNSAGGGHAASIEESYALSELGVTVRHARHMRRTRHRLRSHSHSRPRLSTSPRGAVALS